MTVALLLALLTLVPAPALAHGGLRRSIPAKDAHLAIVPRELRLTFSEPSELSFSAVELRAPDGKSVPLGELVRAAGDPNTLVAAITGPLFAAGTYTVVWRTAGADGHPVRGQFEFVIAGGAAGLVAEDAEVRGEPGATVPAPGQPDAPMAHNPVSLPAGGAFDAESPAYVTIRWLQFIALLVVIGAVVFRYVVMRSVRAQHPPDSALASSVRLGAARAGVWGAAALAVTGVLRLYAQSYALHGSANVLDPSLMGAMLIRTMWGWGWLLQLCGVILALIGFARARRAADRGWSLAALGVLALAVTPALSGHAAAVPDITALTIAVDALHVIGAGGWLGGLLILVSVGVPKALALPEDQRGPAIAHLVNAFSPAALVFAGLVGITGLFAAWINLGSLGALWQTPYGRTLIVKLAVLSAVAGTGAYNWLRVRPALGDVEGGRRITRSARVELAFGVMVLLVTAVLVGTATGKESSMSGRESEPVTAPTVTAPAPAPIPVN